MKKFLTVLMILAVVGGAAWFLLLRPESISQENLTQDFEKHRKAYEAVAYYLKKNDISTHIYDIPRSGRTFEGIKYEDSKEYSDFMEGVLIIMSEDHDAIISDGMTVEFVYHSTGGKFNKLKGSVIYNGFSKADGRITVPLTTDGWHLYIAQG